mgnify:CR=1 FL=1
MIFIIVDLIENVDKYIDKSAAFGDVALMYLYFIPWIFVIVSPVGLLLAANFTGISMAKNSEVIAVKSAGISSFKFALPVYLFGLFWSVVILLFGEFVVPPATQLQKEIKDVKVLKRRTSKRAINYLNYIGENGETYSIRTYNPKNNTGYDVTIVTFDDSLRIVKRVDARTMTWIDDHFELNNTYIRFFEAEKESVVFYDRPLVLEAPEKPVDFEKAGVDPNEMGFFDLLRYIRKSERSGRNPIRERTDLIMKFTFPLSNLIILLFSFPFALRLRKSGAALGFGISFVVAFLYFSLVRIGQSLGYNDSLSPAMAANIGNIIFFSLGLIMLFKYRD